MICLAGKFCKGPLRVSKFVNLPSRTSSWTPQVYKHSIVKLYIANKILYSQLHWGLSNNWVFPQFQQRIIIWLVAWNMFLFFHILGIIIPTDFHIFQRGGSTTNQRFFPHLQTRWNCNRMLWHAVAKKGSDPTTMISFQRWVVKFVTKHMYYCCTLSHQDRMSYIYLQGCWCIGCFDVLESQEMDHNARHSEEMPRVWWVVHQIRLEEQLLNAGHLG